jgi:hypothetical protein
MFVSGKIMHTKRAHSFERVDSGKPPMFYGVLGAKKLLSQRE